MQTTLLLAWYSINRDTFGRDENRFAEVSKGRDGFAVKRTKYVIWANNQEQKPLLRRVYDDFNSNSTTRLQYFKHTSNRDCYTQITHLYHSLSFISMRQDLTKICFTAKRRDFSLAKHRQSVFLIPQCKLTHAVFRNAVILPTFFSWKPQWPKWPPLAGRVFNRFLSQTT